MGSILQSIKLMFKKKKYMHYGPKFAEVDNPQTFDCLCIRCDNTHNCKYEKIINLCKYCKLINLNREGTKKYLVTECILFKERKL